MLYKDTHDIENILSGLWEGTSRDRDDNITKWSDTAMRFKLGLLLFLHFPIFVWFLCLVLYMDHTKYIYIYISPSNLTYR